MCGGVITLYFTHGIINTGKFLSEGVFEVKRQERGIKRVKETLRRLMRLLLTALLEGIRSTEDFRLQEHLPRLGYRSCSLVVH